MPNSEYFDRAFKALMEVANGQQKHWDDLPRMLEQNAANIAVKANQAVRDGVEAAIRPFGDNLAEIKDELYRQGSMLNALKEETGMLTRESSFHKRDLAAIKKEMADLKTRMDRLEKQVNGA